MTKVGTRLETRPSHLFVIDPLESLNLALDSSLRMMAALEVLGHEIHVCEPRHLSWMKTAGATALCRQLRFRTKGKADDFVASVEDVRGLGDFAALHMRKDPPYDLDYIQTTWLLDAAPPSTKIYNQPEALRRFNEKLVIFQFKDEVKPGLVSANPEALLAFAIEHAGGDAIVKPLTLFGGRGVERLQVEPTDAGRAKALAMLQGETSGGTSMRLIQAFDPAIFDGEVRVFTAFGEPVAWCLKKPDAGNYLANTRAGATLLPYDPPPAEKARITRVAKHLGRYGIVFIGFDVIGGYISEINVTSPRLLTAPGEDAAAHYRTIAELIAKDVDAEG